MTIQRSDQRKIPIADQASFVAEDGRFGMKPGALAGFEAFFRCGEVQSIGAGEQGGLTIQRSDLEVRFESGDVHVDRSLDCVPLPLV